MLLLKTYDMLIKGDFQVMLTSPIVIVFLLFSKVSGGAKLILRR